MRPLLVRKYGSPAARLSSLYAPMREPSIALNTTLSVPIASLN
jgi:hypothetical protein